MPLVRGVTHTSLARFGRTLLILVIAVSATACAIPGSPVSPDTVASASSPLNLEADTAFCVSEINRYRASVGDEQLARSARLDAFSTEAARVDGEAHRPHHYFVTTNGGPNIARAQNVIPFWKL
ncbi:MAG: hypothetical protein AB7F99_11620, partial [Vicinamibacterales bacterium]